MALGKQAKTLTKPQIDALLAYVSTRRHPIRNRVILLLSFRAGLHAKEIAGLTWQMVSNADGTLADDIALQDCASKDKSGRHIPMARELKQALADMKACCPTVRSQRVGYKDRARRGNISTGHHQPVCKLVSRFSICRVLQSLRTQDVHYECSAQNFCSGWLSSRCSGACRSFITEHDAAVH